MPNNTLFIVAKLDTTGLFSVVQVEDHGGRKDEFDDHPQAYNPILNPIIQQP
jgi:hypothetical protein